MKVIVCGGRDFYNTGWLFSDMNRFHELYNFTTVIQGGAPGADHLAYEWAMNKGLHVKTVKAQWNIYGKSAGAIRNKVMADMNPDLVIAFPGGSGTADMVRRAKEKGIKVIEVKS